MSSFTGTLSHQDEPAIRRKTHRSGTGPRPSNEDGYGLAYWERFPLDSPEAVRRWERDKAVKALAKAHDRANFEGEHSGLPQPALEDSSTYPLPLRDPQSPESTSTEASMLAEDSAVGGNNIPSANISPRETLPRRRFEDDFEAQYVW